MMLDRRRVLAGCAALAAAGFATPALAGANASDMVAREQGLARAEGKGLLLSFYASWCAWCTPMETLLNQPALQRVIGARFRMMHVRALERRSSQRALQMAGADELMLRFAHPSAGMPFLAFLDRDGDTCGSSFSTVDGQNIGYPSSAEDIDAFVAMIARVAPDATANEHALVRAACQRAANA